jgi:hypothetical protein
VQLHANPLGAVVKLANRAVAAPGRFQGELKVHVCLDAACQSELAGSPMKLPFDVTVRAGLQLDRAAIALALPFGEIPPEQAIRVTLPADGTGEWSVTQVPSSDPSALHTRVSFVRTTSADASSGTVTFRIAPDVPGAHRTSFEIMAPVRRADGSLDFSRKTVAVAYDVANSSVRQYVFFPATGEFTKVFGDGASQATPQPMLANVPTTFVGVEYLSQPAAANGHLLANNWYRASAFRIVACADANEQTCLPPGTYVARLHYVVEFVGDAYWPVTLQVLPR